MEPFIRLFSTPAGDFGVFYNCAKDLLVGKNPYLNSLIFTGLGYPVNAILFFLPLTKIPYQIAQNIFTFVSIFCLYFSVWISFKILSFNAGVKNVLSVFLLSLLFFPVKFTFGMGQNNLIALSFLLLSFFFFKRKKDLLSGIFLGIAINIKTVFLFFVLFYFLKKNYRLVITSLITTGIFVLLTGILFGWDNYLFYFKNEVPKLLNLAGREVYYNQGFLGFFSRITDNLMLRKVVGLIVSFVVIGGIGLITRMKKDVNLQFSLFIISLLLIDSLSWQHHFVLLLFPLILLGSIIKEEASYVLGPLFITSCFLVGLNINSPSLEGLRGIFVSSHGFWGVVFLLGLNLYLLREN